MAKKIQLTIPEPCHENWDNMTPVDKGRFCGSCQKQVVDFSNMSDREVAQFFKKPSTSSVCGRFMQDQLNREMEIPKKRIPWLKYFFQITLPAFLASTKVAAQGQVKINGNNKIVSTTKPLTGDTIVVFKKKEVCLTHTMGDMDSITIQDIEIAEAQKRSRLEDTIILPEVIVTSLGTTVKGKMVLGGNRMINKSDLDEVNSLSGMVGGVSVGVRIERGDSLFKKIYRNIFKQKFKTYPNPVKGGATLNIEWTQSETGDYYMQIIGQSGQVIYSRQLWIDADAKVLNIQVPSVTAGTYFLRMTHKTSGNSFAEKIIIQ
jgi:hypothetical protein